MRMMLKAHFDTEKSNELADSGKLAGLIEEMVDRVHPEAAYFLADDGERTAYVFFDMEDPSQMPVITEPLFRAADAKVSYTPAMNLEDVRKGLSQVAGGSS